MADSSEDWPVMIWADIAARGNVRKWRLHACGCSRVSFARRRRRVSQKWIRLLELTERFADGEATPDELATGRHQYARARKPGYVSGASGDFSLAFYADEDLEHNWRRLVIQERREYRPGGSDYMHVLSRFRVLQDLIGPDPLPTFNPDWRTDTVVSLARGMYADRDFSPMPILADALQDAGCDDPTILDHCRGATTVHVRGCWVVDWVLGKS